MSLVAVNIWCANGFGSVRRILKKGFVLRGKVFVGNSLKEEPSKPPAEADDMLRQSSSSSMLLISFTKPFPRKLLVATHRMSSWSTHLQHSTFELGIGSSLLLHLRVQFNVASSGKMDFTLCFKVEIVVDVNAGSTAFKV